MPYVAAMHGDIFYPTALLRFTPRRVTELAPQIQRLTDHYLDQCLEMARDGQGFDWIGDFAGRLPIDAISEMMGVPEPDRVEVRRLADLVVHREAGVHDVPQAGMEAALSLVVYYSEMVEERKKRPTEDLTSSLLAAEIDGDKLTDEEIIGFLFLMVVAGNETTTKLLGHALFHLTRHPDQFDRVSKNPAQPDDLVVPWLEETLRYDTSSQMVARHLLQDVELHGKVAAGRLQAAARARLGQPRRPGLLRPGPLRHLPRQGRGRPAAQLRRRPALLPGRPARWPAADQRGSRAMAPGCGSAHNAGMSTRIIRAGEGVVLGSADGCRDRFLIDSEDWGGRFAVVEHLLAPHSIAAPMHRHTKEDEFSLILEGQVGYHAAGEELTASVGDLVFKPRGEWHTFWNAADQPARTRDHQPLEALKRPFGSSIPPRLIWTSAPSSSRTGARATWRRPGRSWRSTALAQELDGEL